MAVVNITLPKVDEISSVIYNLIKTGQAPERVTCPLFFGSRIWETS